MTYFMIENGNQLFVQRMELKTAKIRKQKIIKKENPLPLDVLNVPSRNSLISMPSPSSEYRLYHYSKRRINIAVYSIEISKARLFMNLQTYEWRKQTDFPIVKTRYINLKNQSKDPHQKVQIEVFNEYCPLRLNLIYEMSIGQAMYMIKECLIGFQRLFNRFGGFQIQQTMVAINEKGYCRVWINENFAYNHIIKRENWQMKMVHKIIQIIQAHSVESKSSKRLFNALSKCTNFLQSLKMVDTFVMAEKILVPRRFSFFNFANKDQKKNQTYDIPPIPQSFQYKKTPTIRERTSPFKMQDKRNISISPDRNLMSFRSLSPSQIEIKRFKSQNKIPKIESMKVSEGETAYSANNRDIKSSNLGGGNFSCSRETSFIQPNKTERSKGRRKAKWIQQSSFFMDFQQQKKPEPRKQKKQLSQSEAMFIQVSEPRDRKYSANNFHSLGSDAYYKFANIKKSQNDYQIKKEISQFVNDSQSSTPRLIIEEEDESKKAQHENKIIEENGWKSFQDLLKVPEGQGLKQSFHAGGEEVKHPKSEVKLQKLENLSKRKTAMSILPEDYAEDCL